MTITHSNLPLFSSRSRFLRSPSSNIPQFSSPLPPSPLPIGKSRTKERGGEEETLEVFWEIIKRRKLKIPGRGARKNAGPSGGEPRRSREEFAQNRLEGFRPAEERPLPSSLVARNPCTEKGTNPSSLTPPSSKIFQEDHRRRIAFRLWRTNMRARARVHACTWPTLW